MARAATNNSSSRGIVAGFVLALVFAVIYGTFMAAGLIAKHSGFGATLPVDEANTAVVCGLAGSLAALFTWWLQGLVSRRKLVFRFIFALVIMTMVFMAAGGALTVASSYLEYPGKIGPTFTFVDAQDFYITLINGMIAFAKFFLEPARLAILALLPAGAAFIALFGPRYD